LGSRFEIASSPAAGVPHATAALAQRLAVLPRATSALAALALILALLVSFTRGFEWSDEGYYLHWLSSPWDFPSSVSQFGFVYHPLFQLTDGNIVLLRSLNLLATLVLAAILAALLLKPVRTAPPHREVGRLVMSTLPVAALVLVFYKFGPPTPSYNSLNLQSLLIASISLVVLQRRRWEAVWAWALGGFGVALCFLAKPTTALALVPLAAAYFVLIGGWRRVPLYGLLVAAAALVGCLLLAAVLIDGSPFAFVQRLADGREELRAANSGQSLSLLDFISKFDLIQSAKRTLVVCALAVGTAMVGWWSLRPQPLPMWMRACLWIPLIAGLSWAVLSLWGLAAPVENLPVIKAGLLAVGAGAFACAALAAAFTRRSGDVRERLCVAGFLLGLPIAYAFGTNVDPWTASGNAAFFWFLSGLVLFEAPDFRITYVLTAQILVVFAIALHLHEPYRLSEPLLTPKVSVMVPWKGNTTLGLTQSGADYAGALAQLGEKGGLRPRTPMIDLTGHYPGAVYFLGGKPLGAAWMLGGYPGSEAYAAVVLSRASCEDIARAWILTEPNGPRPLPTSLLAAHGIAQESLEEVGSLASPVGEYVHSFVQKLYRPTRPAAEAEAACLRARASKPT
jgi:hypothetical protein